jgi:hypothetical protein
MNVEIKITDEVLENIFVTALEGGSNYWYWLGNDGYDAVRNVVSKLEDDILSTAIFKAIMHKGASVPIMDAENKDDVLGVLTKDSIQKNLSTMAQSDHSWALFAEINEEGDAETSDIVFQYMVMGELIFS